MIGNPYAEFPAEDTLVDRVATSTNALANVFVDAMALCRDLVGEATGANIFLLGVAVQKGAIPVDPKFFEEAISLNGVSTTKNIAAFRWGRAWAHNPELLESHSNSEQEKSASVEEVKLPLSIESKIRELGTRESTASLIRLLSIDLLGYQSNKLAEEYLEVVAKAVRASESLGSEHDRDELVEAVVRGMHKLIAYKDEYEVARLFSLAEIQSEIKKVPQSSGQALWHFHPPFLRALGLKRKLKLPYKVALPLMRLLAKGKFLRGTPFDLFGLAEVRKTERKIRDQYRIEITRALDVLQENNRHQVLALASLPTDVRGFEDIKLRRAEKFLEDLSLLSNQLHG
tara:strand:- start:39 stop:1067 length:1029 start_codon:yes stop_codon:yes gene_type:complete